MPHRIMEEQVILYTTHCPRCKVLTMKLDQKNIKYDICEDTSEMQRLGLLTAPALSVNGEILDFGKAVAWVNARG